MTAPPLTCEIVDRDDIDLRYLAGTLPPDEAEAFEAHYFGCERCWGLVQQGLALRAAKPAAATATARGNRRWIALAAASVLIVSVGFWISRSARTPAGDDAMRGDRTALAASAVLRGDTVYIAWPRVSSAADYRVRVSAPDGVALFEHDATDTTLTIPRSAIASAAADTVFVSVLARDAMRQPVARSALTPFAAGRR
jgi:hypothetical protein